jgi:hypothetical protein
MTVFANGDGTCFVSFDTACSIGEEFLDFLAIDHRVPLQFRFNLRYSKDSWKVPKDNWVGAVLQSGDDYVHISPENVFDPAFSHPCYGLVPPNFPLHVMQRPREHVVAVRHEQIYSVQIAEFLASHTPCQFGDVFFRGARIQSHRRLYPEQSVSVLALEGLERLHCTACGTWMLGGIGVRVGHRCLRVAVCRNADGVGHHAMEHPVIVSLALASELESQFRSGYWLEPIVDIESEEGQRILYLFRKLESLKTSSHKPADETETDH